MPGPGITGSGQRPVHHDPSVQMTGSQPDRPLEIVVCVRCGIHLGPSSRKRTRDGWACKHKRPCDITAGLIPPPRDPPSLLIFPL